MAHVTNLLPSTTQDVSTTTGWTATNGALVIGNQRSLYETTYGSGIRANALKVTSSASGDVEIVSDAFEVDSAKTYLFASNFVLPKATTTSKVEIGIYWYTATDASASVTPEGLEYVSDAWVAYDGATTEVARSRTVTHDGTQQAAFVWNASVFSNGTTPTYSQPNGKIHWVPSGAYAAKMFIRFKNTTAAQEFLVHDTAFFDGDVAFSSVFSQSVLASLADCVRAEDERYASDTLVGSDFPLRRFVTAGAYTASDIYTDLISYEYTRATDASTGIESKSALTDPDACPAAMLLWLAPLLGVELETVASDITPWQAIYDIDTNTAYASWTEWEESVVSGGSEADTTWGKLEAFGAAWFGITAQHRKQVLYGFNGLHAGRPDTVQNMFRTVINSATASTDPIHTRKHHRESNALVMVSSEPISDPDPGGTRLAEVATSMMPAGTTAFASSSYADSALVRYDFEGYVDGLAANDSASFRFGDATSPPVIPDANGSGRHLTLAKRSIANEKVSPFGIIAKSRYFDGHAFYPGNAACNDTASGTFTGYLNIDYTGTTDFSTIDLFFLVSDIKIKASQNIVLLEQGTGGTFRQIGINGSGAIFYSYGATPTTVTSDAFNASIHESSYNDGIAGPRWIRVQQVGTSMNMWVAPSLYEDWDDYLVTASALTVSGTEDIIEDSTDIALGIVVHEETGIVLHRMIACDAAIAQPSTTLSFGDSKKIDVDLLTHSELSDGFTDGWDESGDGYEVTAITKSLDTGVMVGLPHTGTDYLYLGKPPGSGTGDDITVSGLSSGNHAWTVTYTDATTATGTASSATSITWGAATYGGKLIESISVGSSEIAKWVGSTFASPSTNTATSVVGADTYSKTWTLTRTWVEDASYEFSSVIDDACVQTTYGGAGYALPNIEIGNHQPMSLVLRWRRHTNDTTTSAGGDHNMMFYHPNMWLAFYTDDLRFSVTNAASAAASPTVTVSVNWDENASDIRDWNTAVAVRDVVNGLLRLYINGTESVTAADTTLNETALWTGSYDAVVRTQSVAQHGLQVSHLSVYDRALSVAEVTVLTNELSS